MKFALVKQDVYQDLYVCRKNEKKIKSILFSSIMRVGPFGLIADLNADFYIIKEDENFIETQLYKKSLPRYANEVHILKDQTANNLPGLDFLKPGSSYTNGDFSIKHDSVNWSNYDIVISINCAIPKIEITKHPNTLFCYMIGEANIKSRFPKYGYDVVLTQDSCRRLSNKKGVVNFPYTFLSSNTLEKTISGKKNKKGIYVEINSHIERPAQRIPESFKIIQENTNEEIIFHNQNIKRNLENVRNAKYFIKWGGRKIRGNSLVESVSLGTLVIMNPNDVIHNDFLIERTSCKSLNQIIETINFLNDREDEYSRLLEKQKKILQEYYFDNPLKSLLHQYSLKINKKIKNRFLWKFW